MAEEMTDPGQAVSDQAALAEAVVEQAAQTSAPAEKDEKKGSPALTVLTVLLVLVGVVDLALWGLAGYYFLQSF